jgi:histidinol phosphatase-like enzyme
MRLGRSLDGGTMSARRPLIILDRDGTLIDVVRDEETGVISVAWTPSQLRLLPGVLEGLTLLKSAGFAFAIATNQPGPAKGQFSVESVHRTHHALVAALAEAGIAISWSQRWPKPASRFRAWRFAGTTRRAARTVHAS